MNEKSRLPLVVAMTALLGGCSGSDPPPDSGLVRSDGIYQHPVTDYSNYLRFYADRTVLGVSSSGTPADIAGWFDKGNAAASVGTWTLTGTTIQFTTTAKEGSVEYLGEVAPAEMTLQIHSLINDYRHTDVFSFVPLTVP